MHFQSRFFNVIYLGTCFMVLYTAFITLENLHKIFINSIKDEISGYEGDGYFSLMLLFIASAIFMWVAPSIISILGPVKALIISAIGYTTYILAFFIESAWAINLGCILEGIFGSVIWTAQGNYIVLNSNTETVSKNAGIFWLIFQTSALYGNIFVYFAFENKTHIDRPTRLIVISVLLGIAFVACLMLFFLRSPPKNVECATESNEGPIATLKRAWKIFTNRKMIILGITHCFVGLQAIYVMGVYSSCLGFTLQFGKIVKQMVALSGIFIGAGEIVGAFLPIQLTEPLRPLNCSRSIMFGVGVFVQIISFGLMFINLPDNSVFGDTNDDAYIKSSIIIGLICSFFIGMGDSLYNTQLTSLLAAMFPGESAKSIALSNFTRSTFVSLGFFASNHIGLHTQVIILSVLGLIGFAIFCITDFDVSNDIKKKPIGKQLSEIEENVHKSKLQTISTVS